ncbi:MAG: aldo/keto reductase [Oscillospiraceae bacterium]|nr:aldo/keto reductase [Oscillospiraceae bacterium]
MERRILGKTNLDVSVLTFSGIVVDNVTSEKAGELVDLAISRNVNYFDVAPSYGNAQYMLGPALSEYRKDIYLACKTNKRTSSESKEELLESLSALKTDYFDLYQHHSIDTVDEIDSIFALGGAMETFRWALSEGLVKHIGFTCHHNSIAMEMFKRSDEFETMLFPVNYAYRRKMNESIEPLKYCAQHNLGVIAIKSLAQRDWHENERTDADTTWYKPINDNIELARIALNYTLSLEGVTTCPPPGNENMLRLAFDIIHNQAGKVIPPNEKELEYLFGYADSLTVDEMIF